MLHLRSISIPSLTCLALLYSITPALSAEPTPKELVGDWALEFDSGLAGWMRVEEIDAQPVVSFRRYIGPLGPYREVKVEGGRLEFELRGRKKNPSDRQIVEVGLTHGLLVGTLNQSSAESGEPQNKSTESFRGKRIPPMPATPPDLSKVRFGHPITLFNGSDLTGWMPHEPEKINGWRVEDGLLVNATPKTDFSATGDHANLRTVAEFEDFWLHIEFKIGAQRNSGIYLRGTYEAQVVDRDSRMQGLQGVGAIFGLIPPSENAGRAGGEWQTYDITLVDRHVTVVLNGITVIANQPVALPTAGAINTDPSAPGPIYLQGDHTSVAYRNLYLAPVLRD